jgi:hypothetical protein
MWDGREPDLFSQSRDATTGHAEAKNPPTDAQQTQIVTFEGCTTADTPALCSGIPPAKSLLGNAPSGNFTAQSIDNQAGDLAAAGANGAPLLLEEQIRLGKFFIGINDPFGNNPQGTPFSSDIFDLFDPWLNLQGQDEQTRARIAIANGEVLFNTLPINITNVGGINDVLNQSSVSGTCGTCHDTPDSGNHSIKAPLNIGIADAGNNAPPVVDISGLPVFTVQCTTGPLSGQMFQVTDLGRATITGQCTDMGKVKGPILRGLAARAPYFHNGSAASLNDVVEFYNQRFSLGLSGQQKSDLIAFLSSL